MSLVGDAVKLEHGDAATLGLFDRGDEIRERPVRPGVTRRWDQERMIQPRLIGETSPIRIRILGRAAAPGKEDSLPLEDRQGGGVETVSRPGKRYRRRNVSFAATVRDRSNLFGEFVDILLFDSKVVTRVVADLEPVGM